MRLVPFHMEHLRHFQPGERERALIKGRDIERLAHAWEGKAVALVDGEAVLAIAGMDMPSEGEGLVTLALSDELRARPMVLHRLVLRCMARVIAHFGLCRLMASVHPQDSAGVAWLERMGFSFDTALPDYGGSGETYWRYGLDRG